MSLRDRVDDKDEDREMEGTSERSSSVEKADIAKSYGADHVILYTQENVVQRTLELTNGEGVHAIFDGVGKDT